MMNDNLEIKQKLSNIDWLKEQYEEKNLSLQEIADELGTNKQRIRRALMKANIPRKSRSVAQSTALKRGRAKHPTEGTRRPDDVRIKISDGMAKNWKNLTTEEMEQRSNDARQRWYAMPESKREEIQKSAIEAVRKTATEGSRLEKLLRDYLTKEGYDVQYHVEGLIPNQKLELDLFLPQLTTAIEIDGPSHFFPIWGEESLQRNIRADMDKNGLILNNGFVMIRVKQMTSRISKKDERELCKEVLEALQKIENKFPERGHRMIEIEVKH